MANNVKFSTGLQDDLLKRNSDNSYVHKIENGHVYFTTRKNDEGETIGSIFYDVNGKRVSMGGGVAEQAKSDDMKQNIADTYVTRISSEGAKYASTDGVTLTTYNGRNAVLDTILLPVAGTDRAGVVITGAQTFAGNKTFTGIVHLSNRTDASGASDSGVLIIGDKNGEHLIFDGNEIMSKKKTTGTGTLYLNNDGGTIQVGGSINPNSNKTLNLGSATNYWKEAYISNLITDTLSGHLTGSLTGHVTGNVTGHASLDLPLAGGTMTGDISFATIASWPTASGETYPIKSKGLKWSGSSDNASIYYVVEASDKGALYLDMGDDTDSAIKFAMGGTAHTVFESNGNIYPVTTNKGSLGTSANKFASVYATNFYGIIDKAYGDESGNNIRASYGAKLQAHTHDGSGWSFRLLNKNGGALSDALTIPGATDSKAGLVTTREQKFAGKKTFSGQVVITGGSDASKATANSGQLIVGDPAAEHLAIDGNEIMAKSGASGANVLHIQAEGGPTEIGGNFIPKSQFSLGSSSRYWGNAYIKNLVADTLSGHLTGSLTGNLTGNASSATRLQTARKIILGNDLQGEVSFDGTKDVTFTARSYYCSIDGGNTKNYPWRRIATSDTITGSHNDRDMVIAIRHSYNGGGYGIAKVSLRTNNVSSVSQCEIRWLVRQNIALDALQAGFRNVAGDTYADIFYKVGAWPRARVYQLQGDRTWTLISSNEANDTTTSDKKTSSEAYATIEAAATALSRIYTSTVTAVDQGYVERAYKDESGNNIKASYLAAIQQVTSDKDTFTFRGFNKNNEAMNNLITIPGATAADANNANWKAGLVTSQAQTWAGNKTFKGALTVAARATVDTLKISKTEAAKHIEFARGDFNYIATAVNGCIAFLPNGASTGEKTSRLIVEDVGARPGATNTYNLGTSNKRWKNIYGNALDISGTSTLTGAVTLGGNLSVGGTLGVTGATTLESTLDVLGITKLKQGSAATSTTTGALQVTGGIATTSTSFFGNTIIMPNPMQMLRWTSSTTDNNTTGCNWYGIGTYTNSDSYNWLNISNYWGINITTREHTYLLHNGNVLANTGNASGTVGSGVKPVYVSGGVIKASAATVGGDTCPVYLSTGTVTPIAYTAIAYGGTGATTRGQAINNLLYVGNNPITSTTNDTAANWAKYSNTVSFYTTAGCLVSQPEQYGLVLTIGAGDNTQELHQIWSSQPGDLWHRGSNGSSWGGTWRKILDTSNYTSTMDGRYVKVTGGVMTGILRVNAPILGYRYHQSNNAPAFVLNESGGNYAGIGANGTSDTIYFSAVTTDGNLNWNNDYKQKWVFNGPVTADAFNGNATSATIARSLGTDESMKLYAQHSNQLNFGGTNNSGAIYFGCSPADSRPVPTRFIFGGPSGSATLVAANLQGNASSASKVNILRTIGGDSHAEALRAEFNSYKSSIPRNCLSTYSSTAYSNGSFYMGYFLNGYDSNPYGGFFVAHYGTPYYVGISNGSFVQSQLWKSGDAVTGAVWNDYAECRESDAQEAGYVLAETGKDNLVKTIERLQHFAGVSSDTWGFSQGETEKAKTHIAVAGRVLVYPYQDRNNYKPGDCVCAAPGGTVDIMTREEIINYPDRIVGTVSCVPEYETWGGGELADRDPVQVNGRIWIKVR